MLDLKITKELREGFENPYFYDRIYAVIKEENENFCHGEFVLKIEANGIIKVLKSLGIYKTVGRGENKKNLIHPRLKLIIESTIADAKTISKTIIDLVDGKYTGLDLFNLNFTEYSKLEYRSEKTKYKYNGGYKCYLIKNSANDLTKIGMSKKVFSRFQSLAQEFGDGLTLVGYSNRDLENVLHIEYKEKRKFGEWFDLSNNDINDIILKYDFEVLNNEKQLINFLEN